MDDPITLAEQRVKKDIQDALLVLTGLQNKMADSTADIELALNAAIMEVGKLSVDLRALSYQRYELKKMMAAIQAQLRKR